MMMIHHAVSSQKEGILKQPHLTVRPDENRNIETRKARIAAEKNPASVFNRSGLKDYNGKKLSPIQESIMNLQEQMQKVKENEKMDTDTKDELLKTMDEQLKQLEKQLMEENTKKKDEKDKQGENTEGALTKGQSKEDKEAQSLIAVGADLERVESLQSEVEINKGKAKAAQRELDYAVNHPYPGSKPEESSLRLHDKNIIAKKQSEIVEMEETAASLQKEMDKIRQDEQEERKETKKDDDEQNNKD